MDFDENVRVKRKDNFKSSRKADKHGKLAQFPEIAFNGATSATLDFDKAYQIRDMPDSEIAMSGSPKNFAKLKFLISLKCIIDNYNQKKSTTRFDFISLLKFNLTTSIIL